MGVQPGDGVVARFGDAAAVAGIGEQTDAFARSFFDLLAAGTVDAEVLWRVVDLLTQRRSAAPPFGLLAGDGEERRLVLYGAVRAVIGDIEYTGAEAMTWLELPVPVDSPRVAVTLAPSGPVTTDPRTDLGHGMLAGAGFVLEPLEATPPATPLPPSAPPAAQPRASRRAHVPTVRRAPHGETVLLDDDIAHLVAEDGSRIPLDRSYVLGRDPRKDPTVRRGAASPVFIPDPELTVSRVQAYLDITGGVLTVRDAGSSNGTDVAAPGDADWTSVGSEPFALPEGWSLRIGHRVYTHVAAGVDSTG